MAGARSAWGTTNRRNASSGYLPAGTPSTWTASTVGCPRTRPAPSAASRSSPPPGPPPTFRIRKARGVTPEPEQAEDPPTRPRKEEEEGPPHGTEPSAWGAERSEGPGEEAQVGVLTPSRFPASRKKRLPGCRRCGNPNYCTPPPFSPHLWVL